MNREISKWDKAKLALEKHHSNWPGNDFTQSTLTWNEVEMIRQLYDLRLEVLQAELDKEREKRIAIVSKRI